MKWEEKYSQPVIFHCDRLRSPSPPYISPIPIPYYTSAIVDCCMSLTTPHHLQSPSCLRRAHCHHHHVWNQRPRRQRPCGAMCAGRRSSRPSQRRPPSDVWAHDAPTAAVPPLPPSLLLLSSSSGLSAAQESRTPIKNIPPKNDAR